MLVDNFKADTSLLSACSNPLKLYQELVIPGIRINSHSWRKCSNFIALSLIRSYMWHFFHCSMIHTLDNRRPPIATVVSFSIMSISFIWIFVFVVSLILIYLSYLHKFPKPNLPLLRDFWHRLHGCPRPLLRIPVHQMTATSSSTIHVTRRLVRRVLHSETQFHSGSSFLFDVNLRFWPRNCVDTAKRCSLHQNRYTALATLAVHANTQI